MGMRRTLRQGFTMIEMAIAVAASAVVVTGLYQIFTMQSRQFVFLDQQIDLQQNLRFASDVVSRTVRMGGLGAGGSVTGALGYGGDADSALPSIISTDGGSGDADGITVVHMDPSLAIETSPNTQEVCGTDSLTFNSANPGAVDALETFEAGEYIMCIDFADIGGQEAYIWEVTAVDASVGTVSIESNNGYADYDDKCDSEDNLTPILTCSKAEVITFYVDADDDDSGPGTPEHPVLMMDLDLDWPEDDDVPLVDDIEDFQITYCLDDSDCSSSSEWVDEIGEDEGDEVIMVRLSLVGRSAREDTLGRYSSQRPDLENRSGSTTTDNYYRQVLTTEVTVRNLRLYNNG